MLHDSLTLERTTDLIGRIMNNEEIDVDLRNGIVARYLRDKGLQFLKTLCHYLELNMTKVNKNRLVTVLLKHTELETQLREEQLLESLMGSSIEPKLKNGVIEYALDNPEMIIDVSEESEGNEQRRDVFVNIGMNTVFLKMMCTNVNQEKLSEENKNNLVSMLLGGVGEKQSGDAMEGDSSLRHIRPRNKRSADESAMDVGDSTSAFTASKSALPDSTSAFTASKSALPDSTSAFTASKSALPDSTSAFTASKQVLMAQASGKQDDALPTSDVEGSSKVLKRKQTESPECPKFQKGNRKYHDLVSSKVKDFFEQNKHQGAMEWEMIKGNEYWKKCRKSVQETMNISSTQASKLSRVIVGAFNRAKNPKPKTVKSSRESAGAASSKKKRSEDTHSEEEESEEEESEEKESEEKESEEKESEEKESEEKESEEKESEEKESEEKESEEKEEEEEESEEKEEEDLGDPAYKNGEWDQDVRSMMVHYENLSFFNLQVLESAPAVLKCLQGMPADLACEVLKDLKARDLRCGLETRQNEYIEGRCVRMCATWNCKEPKY